MFTVILRYITAYTR